MIARRPGDDRGAVVAELAVALPAVIVVVLLGVGALASASRQVRLEDAAADAARLAARGESSERIAAAVAAAAPGALERVSTRDDLVCVTVTADAVPPLTLSATSCALAGGL